MLQVTTPAADRQLLSMAELRTAAKTTSRADDANLKLVGLQIANAIAGICKVVSSGGNIPTLRKETLTETFRLASPGDPIVGGAFRFTRHSFTTCETITLSRRPILSIASVTEWGCVLDPCQYEVDSGAGTITRLYHDRYGHWRPGKIVVVYDGGWDTVPDDLKLAAIRGLQKIWFTDLKDPLLRSKTIPGVITKDYWNPQVSGVITQALPDDVVAMLRPYTNYTV
jgi:hypothetical protein